MILSLKRQHEHYELMKQGRSVIGLAWEDGDYLFVIQLVIYLICAEALWKLRRILPSYERREDGTIVRINQKRINDES